MAREDDDNLSSIEERFRAEIAAAPDNWRRVRCLVHAMSSPLGTIHNGCSLLEMGGDDDATRFVMTMIPRQLSHANALMDIFKEWFKLEAERSDRSKVDDANL